MRIATRLLMRVAMWRYVFKLFDHEITMARVLISKATLADFGVTRPSEEMQHYADMRNLYRQNQPTAEDIERVVRESDIALTPREFVNKVPLIDRKEAGAEERFGGAGKRFGRQMGLEGSMAHGLAAREYQQILDAEDPTSVPFIRDYYGRQTTLPEYDFGYHTKGPYYDEQGNILPGQVPPVDAVKIMGEDDIASIGTREGYGLKPVPYSKVNMDWEKTNIPPKQRVPSENVGFVGNLSQEDIEGNIAGNISSDRDKGVVGIRGFGRPQDKAFARSSDFEGIEGAFTAPIPPERLVGVMPSTRMTRDELKYGGQLRHLYSPKPHLEQALQIMVSEGEISPMDAIFASIRQRAAENQRDYAYGRTPTRDTDQYFPSRTSQLVGGPSGKYERFIDKNYGAGIRNKKTPALVAHSKANAALATALPAAWEQGAFGLENPILTEAEKQAYIDDIERSMGGTGSRFSEDETTMGEFRPEELTSLYPRQAGVLFI